jgi:hypothetical protein
VAGTYDNDSIDHLEWLLITTAIAVVARYTEGSPDAAREFLLTEVAAGHIRYRYHGKLEFDGWAFSESYFWERNKFVCHEITATGTVIRAGAALIKARAAPPMSSPGPHWSYRTGPTKSDKDGNECYVLDTQRSVTARMPLVQLHRDDIFRRLREMGYMSASDSTSAQQELPLPAPPPPPSSEQARQEKPTSAQQPKQEEPKQWRRADRMKWLTEKVAQSPPPKEARKKAAWCRDRHKEMQTDFGDELPWSDPDSLRRRLDDFLRDNQPGKKV